MIVIVAGSRTATKAETYRAIDESGFADKITTVVSGVCPPRLDKELRVWTSADFWGEMWAGEKKIQLLRYPADWSSFGKTAGPLRNISMISVAEALIAVRINMSSGTSDVIRKAERKGIPIFILDIRR